MAYFAPPPQSMQDHTIFVVGQDDRGRWVVQENHHLVEGVFISRDDALRFAQSERQMFPDSIVLISAPQVAMHLHAG